MYYFYYKEHTKDEVKMRVEILIREIRKKNNINLGTLAKLSGVSKGTLSKIERNEQQPKLITMLLIAKALKCNIEELYKIHF